MQKAQIAHCDGVSGLAVCRKPKSHTVMGFQDLAVCRKPKSHTVMGFQDLAVCRKPKSHTEATARIVLIFLRHPDPVRNLALRTADPESSSG